MPRTDGPSERLLLSPRTPWWGEHRCRYRFAGRYAHAATVLDVACGTGFGVEMLSEAGARQVVGLDVEAATVVAARRSHGAARRHFLVASGTSLPLATASCNLVTSFETIEHIALDGQFLAELRRVLCGTGTLVLSTPNRAYTEMNGQRCANPFHVREYTRDELRACLELHFSRIELLGQRLAPAYRVSPFESDHRRMQLNGGQRLRLLWWRTQNKLPFPIKDRLSWLLSGHSFYPSEADYLFSTDGIETAPVLIALCRP